MSTLLDKINRRLFLEDEGQAEYKDIYSSNYDRQMAEDALYHTIGPLTDSPRWTSKWTSRSEPVPGFKPNGPAPKWTKEEIVYAYAGNPQELHSSRMSPTSPRYGRTPAPLFRLVRQTARKYARPNDKQFISDLYQNGLIELTRMMQPGYDASRSPFISYVHRTVQGAVEHGPSAATRGAIRARGGEAAERQFPKSYRLLGTIRNMGSAFLERVAGAINRVVESDDPYGPDLARAAANLMAALESGDEDRIAAARQSIGDLRTKIKSNIQATSVGVHGLEVVMNTTDPDRLDQLADQVRGKYRHTASHDRNPDNPFSEYSADFYKVTKNLANAYRSGDEEEVEKAKSMVQTLMDRIDDESVTIRGASTGVGQAISGGRGVAIDVASLDAPADDGSTRAGEVVGGIDSDKLRAAQDTTKYILRVALETDFQQLLSKSPRLSSMAQREGIKKIGGPLPANEFRYILRAMGELAANYPGKGNMRSNLSTPRYFGSKWWRPGEDPEIEPIPAGGIWKAIWIREGYQEMSPIAITQEMTEEVREFDRLGIQHGRPLKGDKPVVSNALVSAAIRAARFKLRVIAETQRDELFESFSDNIDRDLIQECLSSLAKQLDRTLLDSGTTRDFAVDSSSRERIQAFAAFPTSKVAQRFHELSECLHPKLDGRFVEFDFDSQLVPHVNISANVACMENNFKHYKIKMIRGPLVESRIGKLVYLHNVL